MAVPDGHTVRCPPLCGPVTLTVATTAAAPLPGIPPRPATCTPTVPKPATAPGICSPARESAIRTGVTDTTAPATAGAAATTAALDGMATGSAETAGAVTAPATTRARPAINTRKWAFMTRPPRNSGGVGPPAQGVAGRADAQPTPPAHSRASGHRQGQTSRRGQPASAVSPLPLRIGDRQGQPPGATDAPACRPRGSGREPRGTTTGPADVLKADHPYR
jgi:hypothetical protein